MTALKAYSQILFSLLKRAQMEPSDKERAEKSAVKLNDQFRRLERMLQDLMDIARIEAGRIRLELQVVNVVDIARDVVELFSSTTVRHELVLAAPGAEGAEDLSLECVVR